MSIKLITSFLLYVTTMSSPIFAQCFIESERTVLATDGVKMGATLSIPKEMKPKAAIVLATGSGTQNRDEEVYGKKPFKTISDFLAANGYAVLRVDDRGLKNPSDAGNATIRTISDDVASAVSLMTKEFPDCKVGILGHSSGGSYAIMNGANNPDVDFIITLAAPAWKGDSLVIAQSRTIAIKTMGRWPMELLQKKIMEIASSSISDDQAKVMIMDEIAKSMGVNASLPEVRKQISAQASGVVSPWYRSMLRYDPSEDLKKIKIPFLALNGSKDMQVPSSNLATISEYVPEAETVELKDHNHLFQKSNSGMPNEYATLEGDISGATLDIILNWLQRNVK